MTSWGAYRTPAAFRAPVRDAANRWRAWILSKRRLWDSELRRAEWERDYALQRIEGLLRQIEIEKDRREGITQDWEREQSLRRRLERDRDQFAAQVLNRERNVAVKEQQLQRLEEQIETAYASGVRDGKFELEELRRMGREPSRGDRIAGRLIKPRAVVPPPLEAHEYQGTPRMQIFRPSYEPKEDEKNGRGPTET